MQRLRINPLNRRIQVIRRRPQVGHPQPDQVTSNRQPIIMLRRQVRVQGHSGDLADSYLATRPSAPQLPPIQSNMNPAYAPQSTPLTLAPYSRDISAVNSPRQPTAPVVPIPKGPVPKFAKCTNVSELQPNINEQPPFRRANPEGGFLSVSLFS